MNNFFYSTLVNKLKMVMQNLLIQKKSNYTSNFIQILLWSSSYFQQVYNKGCSLSQSIGIQYSRSIYL